MADLDEAATAAAAAAAAAVAVDVCTNVSAAAAAAVPAGPLMNAGNAEMQDIFYQLAAEEGAAVTAADTAAVTSAQQQVVHQLLLQAGQQQHMPVHTPLLLQQGGLPGPAGLHGQHNQHHTQQQTCSAQQQKQQEITMLEQQLQTLSLHARNTQQQLEEVQLQQPRISLQQCLRLSRQLTASSRLLKSLLLAVCAGYCGDRSAELFAALLQQVQEHNSRTAAAAVDGLLAADKLLIDVCSLREQKYGRTLLHFLVSEFPAPVIVPDGSLQLRNSQELVQHVVDTAVAAGAAPPPPAAAAAAARTAELGGAAPALCSLAQVAQSAAAAVVTTASANNGGSGGSSSLPLSGGSLSSEQRVQLLHQLRQVALQQGRWSTEMLSACNSNGVPAWLTACHWSMPDVLDFFLSDVDFDLHRHMLRTTPNGEQPDFCHICHV